ncbi:hypothetical protein CFBP5875_04545 [Agrobacterium pusense]|uniref:hypothetical protein n=1 Tax=Agrobacterium pusense TaxID=648995 RepID=UPI0010BEF128|nr:hypothetical protein [Agrobacterium pusense]QCL83887.1 hypothetical protein CFBP5875_04545 [Agrobacterium pusense]
MTTLHYLATHISDIEQDMGLELVVTETSKQNFLEAPVAFNGDRTFYASKTVLNVTVKAEGFVWHHPHGALIRGNFAKPITVATACLDDDGAEIDLDSNYNAVGNAILAKLGKVSALDEIYA